MVAALTFFELVPLVVQERPPRRIRHIRRRQIRPVEQLALPGEVPDHWRPKTRADCAEVERPCPYVGCRHNTYLDVTPPKPGTKPRVDRDPLVKLNWPGLEPWEVPAESSCTLDIADRNGMTLEDVGQVLNLTKERMRQVEEVGLRKLRAVGKHLDDGTGEPVASLSHRILHALRLRVMRQQEAPTAAELMADVGIGETREVRQPALLMLQTLQRRGEIVTVGRKVGREAWRRYWLPNAPRPVSK